MTRRECGFAAIERAPWERDELDAWRGRIRARVSPKTVRRGEPVRYAGPFRFSSWQWPFIAAATAAAVLNYMEVLSVYPLCAVGGMELLSRVLFSDLAAYSQRKLRDVPLLWWLSAYFFPPVTLIYLYFFPVDESLPRVSRMKRDAAYAAACASYAALRAWLRL